MEVLAQLLSLSNIVLCLAIVSLVWVQRKSVEIIFSRLLKLDITKSTIWLEFFVPIGPVATGALLMLVPQVPVPDMFAGGYLSRMVFGLGLGPISGLAYRLIKKNILDKMGKLEDKEKNLYIEE